MTNRPRTLQLASTSPRRREILAALGLEFSIVHVDVDESVLPGESPGDMVVRLAIAKAEAADAGPADIVIAADTAVVADEHVLGKPVDQDDCLAMLGLLSGRAHQVMTGVAVHTRSGTGTRN